MHKNQLSKNRRIFDNGFTIIELIVVIAIIATLTGIVMMNVSIYMTKARDAKRISDMKTIKTALSAYAASHNDFPHMDGAGCATALNGSDDLSLALKNNNILSSMPSVPSSYGDCGDSYYAWTSADNKRIWVSTTLETNISNCSECGGWYPTNGPCCMQGDCGTDCYMYVYIQTAP